MIYALPNPGGRRPLLRDAHVRTLDFRPGECPRLWMRAAHVDPVFVAGGQSGPAERAVWSPWPVVCAVSVEHHRRPRSVSRCMPSVVPRGARVWALRDSDASDDRPAGWVRAGDLGTVVAADAAQVLVRFDRHPEATAVCDPGEVRATPQPVSDVK